MEAVLPMLRSSESECFTKMSKIVSGISLKTTSWNFIDVADDIIRRACEVGIIELLVSPSKKFCKDHRRVQMVLQTFSTKSRWLEWLAIEQSRTR
jgi:cell division inhibitor SulA